MVRRVRIWPRFDGRWAALVVLALLCSACAYTARSSETAAGVQADNSSGSSSVSDDGRYVAFSSTATNLVPGDTNGTTDVFVKDHRTDAVERISVASDGTQGNGVSYQPAISGDGRWVVFTSLATNLAGADANPLFDVFLHDRETGQTTLAGVDENGLQFSGVSVDQPDINDDGAAVAFRVNWPTASQVFRYARVAGSSERVSVGLGASLSRIPGPADSSNPSISADGGLIAFQSLSRFPPLQDPTTSSTWGIAVAHTVDVFGSVGPMAVTVVGSASGSSTAPDIEGTVDSVNDYGWDGRLAFESSASDLVTVDANGSTKDVFTQRRFGTVSAGISLVSEAVGGGGADGPSATATVSEDLRWIAYRTDATNLVGGDTNGVTDVVVEDVSRDRTHRASVGRFGSQATGRSYSPSIAGNGRYVAYTTDATDIVTPDENGRPDVHLRHIVQPTVTGVSPSTLIAGMTTTVTISGEDFDVGELQLNSSASSSFGPTSVSVDGTSITVDVTVAPGTAPGTHDLWVSLLGTGPGTTAADGSTGLCAGCITTG